METKEIVLDASVVIKWFSEETNHEKAKQIRNQFINQELNIILPDLVLYEVANALRYNPRFTEENVNEAIDSLFDMDLTITVPTTNVILKDINIAFETGNTFYDSFYAALASELDIELITADKKFYTKVRGVAAISLLEDIA